MRKFIHCLVLFFFFTDLRNVSGNLLQPKIKASVLSSENQVKNVDSMKRFDYFFNTEFFLGND